MRIIRCLITYFALSWTIISLPGYTSPAFAVQRIPQHIVSLSSGYVILVDKKDQKLFVYQNDNGQILRVFEAPCSTGKNKGPKSLAGDAKTPEGIFFVNQILRNTQPNETYGSIAYALDYPNLMDRRAGRGGNNIWIHGTTRALVPFQSNGCVVLKDTDVLKLEDFIQIQKTPIVISDYIQWVHPSQIEREKRELEAFLYAWQKAVLAGDPQTIDLLYLPGTQPQGKGKEELLQISRKLGKTSRYYQIEPRDVTIIQNANNAVIIFDQITEISKDNTFRGFYQRLYLEKVQNHWYAVADISKTAFAAAPPAEKTAAVSSANPPERYAQGEGEKIRNFVLKWAKDWETGKFHSYRLCYSETFRSRGMNRDAWAKYKEAIRANSGRISISIENIKVTLSEDGKRATVFFVQDYRSSILKNKGKKKLDLRKIGNEWKIERESMA